MAVLLSAANCQVNTRTLHVGNDHAEALKKVLEARRTCCLALIPIVDSAQVLGFRNFGGWLGRPNHGRHRVRVEEKLYA